MVDKFSKNEKLLINDSNVAVSYYNHWGIIISYRIIFIQARDTLAKQAEKTLCPLKRVMYKFRNMSPQTAFA